MLIRAHVFRGSSLHFYPQEIVKMCGIAIRFFCDDDTSIVINFDVIHLFLSLLLATTEPIQRVMDTGMYTIGV